MNKYFGKIPKDKIIISLDISTLSKLDISSILQSNPQLLFLNNELEVEKRVAYKFPKITLMSILENDTNNSSKLIKQKIAGYDINRNSIVTEITINNGKYITLKWGSDNEDTISSPNIISQVYDLTLYLLYLRQRDLSKGYNSVKKTYILN